MQPVTWRNKKSGYLYEWVGTVINSTNAVAGERMVLYRSPEQVLYVRNFDEFHEKFEAVNTQGDLG